MMSSVTPPTNEVISKKIDLDFSLSRKSNSLPKQVPQLLQGTFQKNNNQEIGATKKKLKQISPKNPLTIHQPEKMTYTAIEMLPHPPADMLAAAKEADLKEAHALLPQLFTIREFRKVAVPAVLGLLGRFGCGVGQVFRGLGEFALCLSFRLSLVGAEAHLLLLFHHLLGEGLLTNS